MAKTEIYYTRHKVQSKFPVLRKAITLSSDVGLSWFKLQIKEDSKIYNFERQIIFEFGSSHDEIDEQYSIFCVTTIVIYKI